MHEYEILYQKWKRYRRKKLTFHLLLFTTIVALLFAGYRYYKNPFIPPKSQLTTPNTQNIILPDKNFETQLSRYKPKKRMKKIKKTKKVVKKQEKSYSISAQKPTTHNFVIKSQTTSLTDLKAAYEAAPTAQKALLVARKYYEKKDYKKAAKWAYKANTLDSSNEESWLLFAKSLAKDGKKRKAVTVLRIYYKKSRSPKAKLLMQKIIDGESL